MSPALEFSGTFILKVPRQKNEGETNPERSEVVAVAAQRCARVRMAGEKKLSVAKHRGGKVEQADE